MIQDGIKVRLRQVSEIWMKLAFPQNLNLKKIKYSFSANDWFPQFPATRLKNLLKKIFCS